MTARYINLHFTYLLTLCVTASFQWRLSYVCLSPETRTCRAKLRYALKRSTIAIVFPVYLRRACAVPKRQVFSEFICTTW